MITPHLQLMLNVWTGWSSFITLLSEYSTRVTSCLFSSVVCCSACSSFFVVMSFFFFCFSGNANVKCLKMIPLYPQQTVTCVALCFSVLFFLFFWSVIFGCSLSSLLSLFSSALASLWCVTYVFIALTKDRKRSFESRRLSTVDGVFADGGSWFIFQIIIQFKLFHPSAL